LNPISCPSLLRPERVRAKRGYQAPIDMNVFNERMKASLAGGFRRDIPGGIVKEG
jgi:hypothetical protein